MCARGLHVPDLFDSPVCVFAEQEDEVVEGRDCLQQSVTELEMETMMT
jgi:hypothetical protein